MRRHWGEAITAGTFILLAGYVVWDASALPAGGGNFPIFSAIGIILLSAYWLGRALLRGAAEGREKIVFDWRYNNMKPMAMLALTVLYLAPIFLLGYFAATALYLVCGSVLLGVRSWRTIGLTAVILLPAMYAFFVLFLGANLPRGLLL